MPARKPSRRRRAGQGSVIYAVSCQRRRDHRAGDFSGHLKGNKISATSSCRTSSVSVFHPDLGTLAACRVAVAHGGPLADEATGRDPHPPPTGFRYLPRCARPDRGPYPGRHPRARRLRLGRTGRQGLRYLGCRSCASAVPLGTCVRSLPIFRHFGRFWGLLRILAVGWRCGRRCRGSGGVCFAGGAVVAVLVLSWGFDSLRACCGPAALRAAGREGAWFS